MSQGRMVFAQVMRMVHPQQFHRCVLRYQGDHKVQKFSCWEQFLAMSFAQLTYRESLRDIEACLQSRGHQLYHMGFRCGVARSTLAHANEKRNWRIYADLAQTLIRKARSLYAQEELPVQLTETVYAFDSTTVDLSLSVFPWAWAQQRKSAVKLHTLLDLRGMIPVFVEITPGRPHDAQFLDSLVIEPWAFYLLDRGYIDFRRLYRIHQAHAYFIVRAKSNLSFTRYRSSPKAAEYGIRCDQTGRLRSLQRRRAYPETLRRIHYIDPETGQDLVFLTNHHQLPALTVAQLYKLRWQIELFFKWIKQHLRIKAFFGTSSNAVKTQIWIAVCVYVLIAILKKEQNIPHSLHTILQVLSVSCFEKIPIPQLLTEKGPQHDSTPVCKQLNLWDL
jgi:hypothetical protein